MIRKRDGVALQHFDLGKVIAAIRGAWREVRDDVDEVTLTRVARDAHAALDGEVVDVEAVQDAVEVALMRAGAFDVARAYIAYRRQRAEERAGERAPDPTAIGRYIHASKYARWREDLGRRETYEESVARVENMHLRRFEHLGVEFAAEIDAAFDMVRQRRVLPSMRSMQFGGAAVEANHCRLYNCSFTLVDRPRAFQEALYLLLCGCGVGYSVQHCHVEKLPALARQSGRVVHHVVGDTIEGWADAAGALVDAAIAGDHVEFAFNNVRDRGAPLRTSGGRAPGHLPLKRALERAREVLLGAQGRQLRPIECHRILCHFADAVLAGGIRRSAMIALFSPDDGEMMFCKAYEGWYEREPWLSRANNSAVLLRGREDEEQFHRLFKMLHGYGDPGFYFASHRDHGTNPCGEIGLDPVLVRADGSRATGWAFCNLTTINGAMVTSWVEYFEAARAAAFIGTLQASYTDMPYLGAVTEAIARRDALLGVSITGMQDSPEVLFNEGNQRAAAAHVVSTNKHVAATIGINAAARTTCIKPEGTSSLELSCEGSPAVASGIHLHHERRYIRNVQADENEPPFQAYRTANPNACTWVRDNTWVVAFPVQVGEGARTRDDVGAVEFLDQVRSTQRNWVLQGTARESASPGLRHNVSCTVSVRDGEWQAVEDYVWRHRDDFTGITFLSHEGDAVFANAPFVALATPALERRWRELVASHVPVDYAALREDEDATALAGEAACAGGACSI